MMNPSFATVKECVAVFIELYKNNVFHVLDLISFLTGQFTYTMAYSKDVVRLGYPLGLDLIMGRY